MATEEEPVAEKQLSWPAWLVEYHRVMGPQFYAWDKDKTQDELVLIRERCRLNMELLAKFPPAPWPENLRGCDNLGEVDA